MMNFSPFITLFNLIDFYTLFQYMYKINVYKNAYKEPYKKPYKTEMY